MVSQSVTIPADSVKLEGILVIPENVKGLVLFAHGAGSSRLSPRNQFVAEVLQKARIATLLFDLLTEEEDVIYETRFDINLITERLVTATNFIIKHPKCKRLNIGYFGASTGAAAAINVAARLNFVKAVVSRGGRPDLSGDYLSKLKAPTLLIVGGNDDVVIELNKQAYDKITSEKKMEIVEGATHLFEEPGTLETVSGLASDWFLKYLK
ncbi:hydrolase [Candidatus Woesearchaeota archaeon]|nr:hydrolase [Candidatus Woesearchaeota archaeon]|tara:strand:+ start:13500 stop:14129 length:630 start_codon:yes stop_codon:yes gene_type:complete